ncbi:hypothetical protein WP12_16760 [Sphingomonas sp. SRS2]|nr:hypothetical protein WP12_16760 [Sphingomonas sp. SRS2]
MYRQLNFLPTPPWAARAMAEAILLLDPEARTVWEPACGQGHMAEPFRDYFADVFASDVYPHGHGVTIDFLDTREPFAGYAPDWIATNPPFATAAEFIELGLQRARRGVAMLLRLQFLETEGRFELLYGAQPMTLLAPFIERVPMHLGRWEPKGGTATAYAVFLWRKGADPMPIRPIAAGTKKRLTRASDAARFGAKGEAPLLAAMGGES